MELPDRPGLARGPRYLGYTVYVHNQNGMVAEVDREGGQRWQITGLQGPMTPRPCPTTACW